MKKKHLILPLFATMYFSVFLNNLEAQYRTFPLAGSLDFNLTPANNAYSFGYEHFIHLSMKTGLGIGATFGFSKSTQQNMLSSFALESQLQNQMSGNYLTNYSFEELNSRFQLGFKTTFQHIIVVDSYIDKEKSRRVIDKWFALSYGLRYTFHPSITANYKVISEDSNYIYTDYVDVKNTDSFFRIGPEIGFMVRYFGLAYSFQRDLWKEHLHTFTIRIAIPSY